MHFTGVKMGFLMGDICLTLARGSSLWLCRGPKTSLKGDRKFSELKSEGSDTCACIWIPCKEDMPAIIYFPENTSIFV